VPPVPEVWLIRLAGVAGLLWCATNFRRARDLPNGRPAGMMWTNHTRVNTVIAAGIFLAMLVLSFG
jgi:hypothetical protein